MSLIAGGGSRDIGITLSGDPAAFNATMQQAGATVDAFKDKTKRAGAEVGDSFDRMEASVGKLYAGMRTAFLGGGVAAGVITVKNAVYETVGALVEAQMQLDRIRNGAKFALGADQAVREIQFLREATNALGLEFNSTARLYTRLAAASRETGLEGRATRDIFLSVGQAATVMGLSVEETQGAMLAITQMISKGKVQAEELRGQLGERLPGAFQIAARAMGVTTAELDKMLERGEVVANDFLPKFARQLSQEVGPSVQDAAQSMQASVNRMGNEWSRLKQTVVDAGLGRWMAEQGDILTDGMRDVSTSIEDARKSGSGFAGQMIAATGAVLRFANPINFLTYNFQDIATKERIAREELAEFEAALAKDPANVFLTRGIAQLKETVAWLQRAREEQQRLAGAGDPGETAGTFARRDRGAYAGQLAEAQKTMSELTLKAYQIKQRGVDDLGRLDAAGALLGVDDKTMAMLRQKLAAAEALHKGHNDNLKALLDARFSLAKAHAEQMAALEANASAVALRDLERARKNALLTEEDYYRQKEQLELAAIDSKERLLVRELKDAEAALAALQAQRDKARADGGGAGVSTSEADLTREAAYIRARERLVQITTKLYELGRERVKVQPAEEQIEDAAWDRRRKNMEDLARMREQANQSLIESGRRDAQQIEELEAESLDRRLGLTGDTLRKEMKLLEIRHRYEREQLDLTLAKSSLLERDKQEIIDNFEKRFTLLGQRLQEENGPLGEARDALRGLGSDLEHALYEGGEGAGEALKRYFKGLVFRVPVQLAAQGITGAIGSVLGIPGAGGGLAGGGGLGAALGGWPLGGIIQAPTILNAVGGLGSGVGTIGSALAGLSGGFGLAGGTGVATAAQLGAGFEGLMASQGILASSGGTAAGATGLLGAIPGAGWALAAVALLSSLSGSFKGETRSGGQYGYKFADADTLYNARRGTAVANATTGINLLEGPSGGELAGDQVRQAIEGVVKGIGDTLRAFGTGATLTGYQAGLESSEKDRGGVFAGGTLRLASGQTVGFGESGQGDNYAGTLFEQWSSRSPNGEQAIKAFALDTVQSYLQAIQAAAGMAPVMRTVSQQVTERQAVPVYGYTGGAEGGDWGVVGSRFEEVTRTVTQQLVDTAAQGMAEEASKVPKLVRDLLRGKNIEALGETEANALMARINEIALSVQQFFELVNALPVAQLKGVSNDVAANLAALSGGIQQFSTNLGAYVQNFYTAEEQRAQLAANISNTLTSVGVQWSQSQVLTGTREQFRALAESLDVASDAGQRQYAALMSVAGAFAQLTQATDDAGAAAARAADLLKQRTELEDRLFALTASESDKLARVRQRELEAADDSLRALLRQIYAQEDLLKAQEAAAKAAQETATALERMRGLGGNLAGWMADLRATRGSTASPEVTLAQRRATYLQDLALARTNDADALGRINQSAQGYIDAQTGYTASSTATQAVIDQVLAEVGALPAVQSWQQQVLAALGGITGAIGHLPDPLASSIATRFGSLDLNVNGILTRDELAAVMGPMATDASLQALWAKLDANGDGTISAIEALRASYEQQPGAIASGLLGVFQTVDLNRDLRIGLGELQAALAGKATDEQLQVLMQHMDANGDGYLAESELLRAAVNAQPQALTGLLRDYFTALDRNTDGLLTREELAAVMGPMATDASLQSLWAKLDTDNDGVISRVEALQAAAGQTTGAVLSLTPWLSLIQGSFASVDRNLDGLLTRDELAAVMGPKASDASLQALWSKLDANQDGVVSRLEALRGTLEATPAGLQAAIRAYFDTIDFNGGGLTKADLQTALGPLATDEQLNAVIRALDVNGDGVISRLESLGGTVSTAGQGVSTTVATVGQGLSWWMGAIYDQFGRVDANLDGLLTRDELAAVMAGKASDSTLTALFQSLDANGDGVIDRLEALRGTADYGNSLTGQMLQQIRNDSLLTFPASEAARVFNDLLTWSQQSADRLYLILQSMSATAAAGVNRTPSNIYYNPGSGSYVQLGGQGFATGGAFTNGIVQRAMSFPLGLMGEKTQEGILPLANVGGSLGVHAAIDPSLFRDAVAPLFELQPARDPAAAQLRGELAAMREELAAMRAELHADLRQQTAITAAGARAVVDGVAQVATNTATSRRAELRGTEAVV